MKFLSLLEKYERSKLFFPLNFLFSFCLMTFLSDTTVPFRYKAMLRQISSVTHQLPASTPPEPAHSQQY